MANDPAATKRPESTETSSPKTSPGGDRRLPPVEVSPEGVPYQSSGFPEGVDNPGPFETGEGKNSPLLKSNQESAREQEDLESQSRRESDKSTDKTEDKADSARARAVAEDKDDENKARTRR